MQSATVQRLARSIYSFATDSISHLQRKNKDSKFGFSHFIFCILRRIPRKSVNATHAPARFENGYFESFLFGFNIGTHSGMISGTAW